MVQNNLLFIWIASGLMGFYVGKHTCAFLGTMAAVIMLSCFHFTFLGQLLMAFAITFIFRMRPAR